MPGMDDALTTWQATVGSRHVCVDPSALRLAETSTYAVARSIAAILTPGDRSEVQACVRIAHECGIPLYPVSRGKNWGYGSRVPVTDGCVLLDLHRLDRVVEYDEHLAFVTVEPGVTFRQLFEFLRTKGSSLLVSGTGSSPDTSIIGNTVERGIGVGRYAERASTVCGFEVVLPTGVVIHTGFRRYENAAAARVYRWGVGPYVDGLFCQSNLGVVTELTLWLQPCPDVVQLWSYRLDDPSELPGLIARLRDMTIKGYIPPSHDVRNDYRTLAEIMPYPWNRCAGQTPLDEETKDQLKRALMLPLGVWNGTIPLHAADHDHLAAQSGVLERMLGPAVSSWHSVEASRDQLLQLLAAPTSANISDSACLALMRYIGIPDTERLRAAYWRKSSMPPDPDPDRDRCGLIWCQPVVPFDPEHVQRVIGMVTRRVRAHRYEPMLSLRFTSERSGILIVAILYDRDIEGEDDRAADCYRALITELEGAGYYPYRRTTLTLADHIEADGPYDTFLRTLKHALDPNGILAPGRYLPVE